MRARLLAWAVAALLTSGPAAAQVELDGSLGSSGVLPAGEVTIGEELGARSGDNLFHSFRSFDVPAGTSATFLGDPGIARVIARVTGERSSQIDGVLRSEIPGADLFLLNPQGVVFGSGAELDLGGSLYVGAAQSLQFRDGESLPALALPPVRLSSEPPEAWGFSGSSGALVLRGAKLSLQPDELRPDRVLSLAASEIQLQEDAALAEPEGLLSVPGGRLELAAARAGRVLLTPSGPVLDGAEPGPIALQHVRLDVSSDRAGTISIRARDLELRDADLFADTGAADAQPMAIDVEVAGDLRISGASSDVTAAVVGAGDGGAIRIATGGTLELRDEAFVSSQVQPGATGSSGPVHVRADRIVIRARGQLRTLTRGGPGSGGSLDVQARRIEVEGIDSALGSYSLGAGTGGDVTIEADEVVARAGGQILSTTRGSGSGGDLDLRAGEILVEGAALGSEGVRASAIQVEEQPESATGFAGRASITAQRVEVRDGGVIGRFSLVEDAASAAEPGGLSITASELVVAGSALLGEEIRRAQVTTRTRDRGAGTLRIDAGRVEVLDGGQISATTQGRGDAGRLEIVAPEIRLAGSGARQYETGIFSGSVTDEDRPGITGGNAGEVILATRALQVGPAARISVSTDEPSQGGKLHVNVPEDLADLGADPAWATEARIHLAGGELQAEARAPGATGGEIRVHAAELVLDPGSQISTLHDRTGDSGNIEIVTRDALRATAAGITTESKNGQGGDIEISAGRRVYLLDSEVETSVTTGVESGGNIRIDPDLVVLNRSAIRANADEGPGGDIEIIAGRLVRSADSVIEASSNRDIDGEITIRSPVEDLEGETARLEAEYLDASDLMGSGCGAGPRAGTLTRVGRAAVVADPDALLAPRAAAEETCAPAD